jgi:hypothetical protein
MWSRCHGDVEKRNARALWAFDQRLRSCWGHTSAWLSAVYISPGNLPCRPGSCGELVTSGNLSCLPWRRCQVIYPDTVGIRGGLRTPARCHGSEHIRFTTLCARAMNFTKRRGVAGPCPVRIGAASYGRRLAVTAVCQGMRLPRAGPAPVCHSDSLGGGVPGSVHPVAARRAGQVPSPWPGNATDQVPLARACGPAAAPLGHRDCHRMVTVPWMDNTVGAKDSEADQWRPERF